MATYTSYDLVEFGKPLEKRERELPEPAGAQVLVRIRRSGVCHSDVHIAEGFFDLGSEGKFRMTDRGMKLPMALGHEILGEVVAAGPDAFPDPEDSLIGKTMMVHPWIGCGECRACTSGRENECTRMNPLGVLRDGGYATHVLVDHPRWLVDVEGLDLDTVTPYSCSGLTVYNALLKAGTLNEGEWLAVMGAGGLGLNAVAIARAMGFEKIVSVDIDDRKLQAAAEVGADAVLNGGREDAIEELRKITGNQLLAVVDTVGAPSTARLAVHALIKMGRYVVVGLYGGDLKMPLPWLPQKHLSILGSYVGNCNQLRELIEMVKTGKVKEIPVTSRPLSEASQTLEDLKEGRITGRVVLTTE
jgi:D-arabinose 1-dehydrogenase-like Zn-dependent alcohol dehydrogenase